MGDKFTVQVTASGSSITFNFPPEVIDEFCQRLKLQYIQDGDERGKVCFANDPDVRPEYREVFTDTHLQSYIYAFLQLNNKIVTEYTQYIPYPADAITFWHFAGERK